MTDLDRAVALLAGGPVFVLAGAGMSTRSGIPDYRGPGTRERARRPIQHAAFLREEATRQRYWARAFLGWPAMRDARPNVAHEALAELEAAGRLAGLVTQNVDGLHQKAGHRELIELHGALRDVICLACGVRCARDDVQERLAEANPGWMREVSLAPDGDAELGGVEGFTVVACEACGGPLKPDVVFFGDNVPRARVDAAFAMLASASAVLVTGSSLAVFSGWRFVKRAHEAGVPVVVLNLGPTRADEVAAVHLDRELTEVLPALAGALTAR
ncbi:MAG: NAD-dependent protein deacetylase [Alphaproteobacteria bacterium]|nr:NAD-dependent protein deacetylase [Alphaproteobacteria bacterium]